MIWWHVDCWRRWTAKAIQTSSSSSSSSGAVFCLFAFYTPSSNKSKKRINVLVSVLVWLLTCSGTAEECFFCLRFDSYSHPVAVWWLVAFINVIFIINISYCFSTTSVRCCSMSTTLATVPVTLHTTTGYHCYLRNCLQTGDTNWGLAGQMCFYCNFRSTVLFENIHQRDSNCIACAANKNYN